MPGMLPRSFWRNGVPSSRYDGDILRESLIAPQRLLFYTLRRMNQVAMNVRTAALVGHQACAFVGQPRTIAAPLKVFPDGTSGNN